MTTKPVLLWTCLRSLGPVLGLAAVSGSLEDIRKGNEEVAVTVSEVADRGINDVTSMETDVTAVVC